MDRAISELNVCEGRWLPTANACYSVYGPGCTPRKEKHPTQVPCYCSSTMSEVKTTICASRSRSSWGGTRITGGSTEEAGLPFVPCELGYLRNSKMHQYLPQDKICTLINRLVIVLAFSSIFSVPKNFCILLAYIRCLVQLFSVRYHPQYELYCLMHSEQILILFIYLFFPIFLLGNSANKKMHAKKEDDV